MSTDNGSGHGWMIRWRMRDGTLAHLRNGRGAVVLFVVRRQADRAMEALARTNDLGGIVEVLDYDPRAEDQ